ncbi:beta-glucosidase [Trichophyton tonsurans CBS 112818]|uniref:Probable beta-glucosidase btgE n=1 Tax=Trichophyton tonsurans (strain CBS 112818) TaxID=647933 RepID=F2RS15_TRIT1|nr:beta-glucosidase [Trichophyton tonsurans CBS 112818]
MKSSLFIAAAGLLGSAVASPHAHGHGKYHRRAVPNPQETCFCETKVVSFYGPATLVFPKPTPTPTPIDTTTTVLSTSYTTVTVNTTVPAPSPAPSSSETPHLPTAIITVYPTPGTYTIPPTTYTVPTSATVCPPSSAPTGSVTSSVPSCSSPTTIPPGTYTQPGMVVTVTITKQTITCPAPTNTHPAPPPPPPPTTNPAPTTAQPSQPPQAPTSKAPEPPKTPTSSEAPAPKPSGGLGGGKTGGMTYSPYSNNGQCKDAGTVMKDISVIKAAGFTTVRLYATDCDGLKNVGDACKAHGVKMVIGVFISETGVGGAGKQVTDITSWAQWDLVTLIVVGNEAIQSGRTDAGALAGFIVSAKSSFKAAGYNGMVTTTETVNVWQASGSTLCSAIDVLGANIHCFFNPDVTADKCGSFVRGQIELLSKICPGKQVFNLETGWPTQGSPNNLAVPGISQQKQAIESLVKEVGPESIFFSFLDDSWKDPGQYGVEQHWGCIDVFKSM